MGDWCDVRRYFEWGPAEHAFTSDTAMDFYYARSDLSPFGELNRDFEVLNVGHPENAARRAELGV